MCENIKVVGTFEILCTLRRHLSVGGMTQQRGPGSQVRAVC